MKLETSTKRIKQISLRKEDENLSFRSYLKGQDMEKVDEIVHRLYNKIAPQIDCLKCGNCCTNLRPLVSAKDICKLAELDQLTPKDFEEKFIECDESENSKYLKSIPCKYLDDKKCTVYSDRPDECKSYPYLLEDEFSTRSLGVILNCEICPIVFNVFEFLKQDLRWRYR